MRGKASTERFSARVENYRRFRPGYPGEAITLLRERCGLSPKSTVADIAFGTGIFTQLLCGVGCNVFGVEPNAAMREAGEEALSSYSNFKSVDATAEQTSLPEHSVDLITAAQAAHWFAPAEARKEFLRILKPGGAIALIWNVRDANASPFAREYEAVVLNFGTDYCEVRHDEKEEAVSRIIIPGYRLEKFRHTIPCDYAAVEGRLLSSSYVPQKSDANFDTMIAALRKAFDQHQQDGQVAFEYETRVYYGTP